MERLRKSTASSILALLLTALLPSSSLGVARFDQYHVNPAIVPMPVVYSYADCIARYGFCICTLTGLEQGEMDRFLADYDEDNDGKFNWLEIKRIQDEGIWKEQYYTDQQYLACRYDPPAPGPYEIQECERLFGAGDCVCSGMGDTIVCYGRAVTELSPEPMKVDRAFCLPYNPGGFDCTCTSPDRLLASAEASTCFVNSHDDEVDYECLEEVRIFPGRPYDCVASGFWADKCCPADLDCEIDEYDPGFNTGLALSATNTVLKTYIAYQGYAAGTTGANVAGFASSVMSGAEGEGLNAAAETFTSYYNAGAALNPVLGYAAVALSYIALAYMLYTMAKMFLQSKCEAEDFELACKHRADLCIFVDKYKEGGMMALRHEVYTCFNSQIARVVNEYGLPQIYAPACHARNCTASDANKNCGCVCAYAEGCEADGKRDARYEGFTIDQFQRLDFAEIPIGEELLKTALPEMLGEDLIHRDEMDRAMETFLQPSSFETARVEGSVEDQAASRGAGTQGEALDIGFDCPGLYPAPGWQSSNLPPGFQGNILLRICNTPPASKARPGRFYLYYSLGSNKELDALAARDDVTVTHYKRCAHEAFPMGGLDYTNYLTGGFGFPRLMGGYDCWMPDLYESFFYNSNPWTGGMAPGYDWLVFSRVMVAGDDQYYSAEFSGDCPSGVFWVDGWVFWLTDDEIERGRWIDSGRTAMRFDPPARTARNWIPPDPTLYGYNENGANLGMPGGPTFKNDPVCRDWYTTYVVPACLDVELADDCGISRSADLPDIGENWIQIRPGCTPGAGYLLDRDYFRSCPALAADIMGPEMVCPRPRRQNLRQAFRFMCPGSSAAHDAYFNQAHVQALYQNIGP